MGRGSRHRRLHADRSRTKASRRASGPRSAFCTTTPPSTSACGCTTPAAITGASRPPRHAARRLRLVRPDDRQLPRSSHRVRLRRQPGRRQARRDQDHRRRRQFVGRRCGTWRPPSTRQGGRPSIAIPFSQLRFRSSDGRRGASSSSGVIGRSAGVLGVHLHRPSRERGGVPRYGHLEGLRDDRRGKAPGDAAVRGQRAPSTSTREQSLPHDRRVLASAGLDLRYRASSNLTLNATFNPDFGQVEVDPAVVNLGVYETFFEEKRPFFIEGNEIFDFGAGGTSGGQMFYCRDGSVAPRPCSHRPTRPMRRPPPRSLAPPSCRARSVGGRSDSSRH